MEAEKTGPDIQALKEGESFVLDTSHSTGMWYKG